MPYSAIHHKQLESLLENLNVAEIEGWRAEGGICYDSFEEQFVVLMHIDKLPNPLKIEEYIDKLDRGDTQ